MGTYIRSVTRHTDEGKVETSWAHISDVTRHTDEEKVETYWAHISDVTRHTDEEKVDICAHRQMSPSHRCEDVIYQMSPGTQMKRR